MESPSNQGPSLSDRSSDAARTLSVSWMRGVLREVALLAIRQSLSISDGRNESNNTDGQSIPRISLIEKDVLLVKCTCRKVAQAWEEKLREIHHDEVADWLKQLVERELDILFEPNALDATEAKTHKSRAQRVRTTSQTPSEINNVKSASTVKFLEIQRAIQVPSILDTNQSSNQNNDESENEAQKRTARAIAKIDEMGRHQETDWPYDWASTIEPAAAQIQSRLYPSKANRDQIDHSNEADSHAKNAAQEQMAATESILLRKRKSSHKRNDIKKHKDILPPAKKRHIASIAPRQPADVLEDRFAIENAHQIVSSVEIDEHLLSCIEESGSNNQASKTILLGNLCELGWNHAWMQQLPQKTDCDNSTLLTSKRSQYRTIKDRLGDHVKGSASDYGMVTFHTSSKVCQTQDRFPSTEASTEHWLELDMAGCPILLDVALTSETSGTQRKLYAFSSIEVIALDEDKQKNATV